MTLRSHTAPVRWVDLSSDGIYLCSASSDKTVKVWDIQRQKFIYSLSKHNNWIRCCKYDLSYIYKLHFLGFHPILALYCLLVMINQFVYGIVELRNVLTPLMKHLDSPIISIFIRVKHVSPLQVLIVL